MNTFRLFSLLIVAVLQIAIVHAVGLPTGDFRPTGQALGEEQKVILPYQLEKQVAEDVEHEREIRRKIQATLKAEALKPDRVVESARYAIEQLQNEAQRMQLEQVIRQVVQAESARRAAEAARQQKIHPLPYIYPHRGVPGTCCAALPIGFPGS